MFIRPLLDRLHVLGGLGSPIESRPMTKAPACLILATCLLAACGNNETTPEPGEYQQTVKITELGFPGLEGEARSQMIEQMEAVGSGPESRFCMESEEGEGQWKEAASQMAGVLGGNC